MEKWSHTKRGAVSTVPCLDPTISGTMYFIYGTTFHQHTLVGVWPGWWELASLICSFSWASALRSQQDLSSLSLSLVPRFIIPLHRPQMSWLGTLRFSAPVSLRPRIYHYVFFRVHNFGSLLFFAPPSGMLRIAWRKPGQLAPWQIHTIQHRGPSVWLSSFVPLGHILSHSHKEVLNLFPLKKKKKSIYLTVPGASCGLWDLVPWPGIACIESTES